MVIVCAGCARFMHAARRMHRRLPFAAKGSTINIIFWQSPPAHGCGRKGAGSLNQSVFGAGGANVDVHGHSYAPIRLRDSNPGALHISLGGVCRNICDNLARLGVPVTFASAVGGDAFGQMLLSGCRAAGMDTSCILVREGARSGSYISIMDDANDMLVGMSDMDVLGAMSPEHMLRMAEKINASGICVTDANLEPRTLEALCDVAQVPVFLDTVSCAKAQRLRGIIGRFDTIKPNRMELEALTGLPADTQAGLRRCCDALLQKGVRRLFVSLGADGLYYQDAGGCVIHKASRPFPVVNATGAGDAAMAGVVYAALHGFSPEHTVEFAIGCSLCAISSSDTIRADISPALCESYIKEYVR